MTRDPTRGLPAGARRAATWGLAVAALLLWGRFALVSIRAAGEPAHGFVAHYTASRQVLEGGDVAQLYNDAAAAEAVRRFEPGVIDIFNANPPTAVLAAMPVAFLDYRTARLVWTVISLLLWIGAVLWLVRATRLSTLRAVLFLVLAAAYHPAFEHLAHAQFYIAVLVLILCAWRTLDGRPHAAGAALGTALAVKAAALTYWPLLLVQRRWRALLAGAALFGLVAVLLLPVAGPAAWRAFFARAAELGESASLSVTAYQTVPGLVRRLTVADPQWNPEPLLSLEWGRELSWVVAALLLGIALIAAVRQHEHRDRTFAGFAALGLVLSPVSLDYHYVLAIFPIAVLMAHSSGRVRDVRVWALAFAIALIAADLPYRSPRLADGALALFAYPKLYGALVLSGLSLTRW